MSGFTEEWLADHQHKIAVQRVAHKGPMTDEERRVILAEYVSHAKRGELRNLIERLGRPPIFVHRAARELGLTKYGQGSSETGKRRGKLAQNKERFIDLHVFTPDEELAKIFGVTRSCITRWRKSLGLSKDRKSIWKINQHPRGFSGATHSVSTRQVISVKSRAAWTDPASPLNSEGHRQILSDRMSAAQAAGSLRNSYSRGSMGKRSDLGNAFFRSTWEANYARYLNFLISCKEIAKWEYETDTFWFLKIMRGVRSYKPDFKIWERSDAEPYYVEIKGWMDTKSATKLRRMKIYHPSVRIVLVGAAEYRALVRIFAAMLPYWERPRESISVPKGIRATAVRIERLA